MRTRTPSLIKEPSNRSFTRSMSPIDSTFITSTRAYTPYPLYKQKVRTLLKPPDYSRQPPNFMSARETRSDFEKKEASLQVKLLKRTFNLMRESYNKGNRKMNMLISESHKVSELEHVGQHDVNYLENYYKGLAKEEQSMLAAIREESGNNIVYKHVRERLRQTLMHLELKNQYLQSQFKAKDFLIESEHRKKIKTLEKKFTMVQTYKVTSKTVSLDLKDRTQDLNILEDDIEAREKIHDMREKRMRKYEVIAETAAIEEGDLKSNYIREKLLMSLLWTRYLTKYESKIRKQSLTIIEAFKKIKIVTKINEPNEVVEKFLRKEEKLTELMHNLNDIRSRCQETKEKNKELENKIQNFNLTQSLGLDGDIKTLRSEVSESTARNNALVHKKDRLVIIKQNVLRWAARNLSALGQKPKKDMKMAGLFKLLEEVIVGQIRSFKEL